VVPVSGFAADAAEGNDGGATLGTGAAVDVAGVVWGASENAVCDGVGQLSDPLEGHVPGIFSRLETGGV
jgi:hypothetical protein